MTTTEKPGRQRKAFSAREKCRAVLAVWVEQRTASEVCRQMGIRSGLFRQWQEAAMEGMLWALEPTGRKEEPGRGLSPRLRQLLEKKSAPREGRCPPPAKRQASAPPPAPAST